MTGPWIRAGVDEDALWHVAGQARQSDRTEVFLASGNDVLTVLRASVGVSEDCYTVFYDDAPVAVFGFRGVIRGAVPWLIGTDRFVERPDFVKAFPASYIDRALARYGYLFNFVHAENHVSRRWLEHLGFRMHPPVPYGAGGAMFHYFDQGDRNV